MRDDNPFMGLLGLITLVVVVVVIAIIVVYPIETAVIHLETPSQIEKIESLKLDVRYYTQVEKCIPANVIADVEEVNRLIEIRRNPHKLVDPAIPNVWREIESIEIPQNIKLCN